jgi:hypothetical protein
MTLEEFAYHLKSLIRRAAASGLDVEQVCELTEYILQDDWSSNE